MFLLWLTSLVACSQLHAIAPERKFSSQIVSVFSRLNDLPRNGRLQAFAQDPSGRIWAATSVGVYRYSGERFEAMGPFAPKRADGLTLPVNVIALTSMSNGWLYALSNDGEIYEWDHARWQLRFQKKYEIHQLGVDLDQSLLLAGRTTLYKLQNNQLVVHPAFANQSPSYINRIVTKLDRVWLMHGPTRQTQSIASFGADNVLTPDSHSANLLDGLTPVDFDVAASGARVAAGLQLRYRHASGITQTLTRNSPDPNVSSVFRRDGQCGPCRVRLDRNGGLWIAGMQQAGILHWSPSIGMDERLDSLPDQQSTIVMEDASGAIWGGMHRGAVVYRDGPIWQRWLNWGVAAENQSNGSPMALAHANGGGFWIAAQNGLLLFDANGSEQRKIASTEVVRSVAQADDGTVYASTNAQLLKLAGEALMPIGPALSSPIMAMAANPSVRGVWVATSDALYFFDGLTSTLVMPLAAPPGMFWVESDGSVLLTSDALYRLRMTKSGAQIDTLLRPSQSETQLRGLWREPSAAGLNGALWIATHGEGVWRWAGGLAVEKFGTANGLGMQIESAVTTHNGDNAVLWLVPKPTTFDEPRPFFAINVQSLRSGARAETRILNHREGLIGPSLFSLGFPNTLVDASTGKIWIAGQEGLAIVAKTDWKTLRYVPAPRLAEMFAAERLITDNGVAWFDETITLRVNIPNVEPERMALWQKIDTGDWQRAPALGRVDLGRLALGAHKIALQTRLDDELTSETTFVKVKVSGPFWRYLWFSALMGALGTAAIFSTARYRIRVQKLQAINRAAHEQSLQETAADWAGLARFDRIVLSALVQSDGVFSGALMQLDKVLGVTSDLTERLTAASERLRIRGMLQMNSGGQLSVRASLRSFSPALRPLADVLAKESLLISHYRTLEVLGEGGMGMVYRALDLDSGEQVALKLVRLQHNAEANLEKRFFQEIQSLGKVRHPNVVRLLDSGKHGNDVFLALEFVPGESLANRLKLLGALTSEQALPILRAIAEGLLALHAGGVTHRDVKPANIVCRNIGGAILIDLGLALNEEQTTRLTQIDQTAGTLGYMAPEQLIFTDDGSAQVLTTKLDWWAYGVVCFEALVGLSPWATDGMNSQLVKISMFNPNGPPRRAYPENFPADWRALIDSCLVVNAEDRMPDLRILGLELRH